MKKVKSISAIGLSLAMVLSLASGCSSKSSDSATATAQKVTSPITISYAIWDTNEEPGMKAMATQFHKENPNITIDVQVTAWDDYWTKMDAAASGGSLPDTFWMHSSNEIRYAKGGMLMDLTQKVASSTIVKNSDFPSGLVTTCSYKGKQYGIPKDYDTIALWYNKTMFDAKGIKYPDSTWTWTQFEDAAKKLTDTTKGIYGYLAPEDEQQGMWNFIYQNGGYPISNDRSKTGWNLPATKEALKFYLDLSQVDKVSPLQSVFANTAEDKLFYSGKAAMATFGSWMISEFNSNAYTKANCDIAVLPQGKTRASIYNGLSNAVSAKTKNATAAWKWVEYLGTKEANDIQSEYGSAIPAYNGCTSGFIKHYSNFNVKAYTDQLSYAVINPTNWEGDTTFSPQETTILTQACNGKLTADAACDQLSEKMTAAIAATK